MLSEMGGMFKRFKRYEIAGTMAKEILEIKSSLISQIC